MKGGANPTAGANERSYNLIYYLYMENEQQPQYNQQPQIIKKGMSTGAAIVLAIGGIIVAVIIAAAIIFSSGTKTIRDMDFEKFDGFEVQINENGEETVVNVATKDSYQEQQETPADDFFVVDSHSGVTVSSPTFTVNGKTYSNINSFISYMKTLVGDKYNVTISAPGYQTMSVELAVPGNLNGMTVNLVPTNSAHDCPRSTEGTFLLCGYVTSQENTPISNVEITSPIFGNLSGSTESDGYYEVEFDTTQSYDCGNPAILTYSKKGYKTLELGLEGFIFPGSDLGYNISLTPGSGSEQKISKHGQCLR